MDKFPADKAQTATLNAFADPYWDCPCKQHYVLESAQIWRSGHQRPLGKLQNWACCLPVFLHGCRTLAQMPFLIFIIMIIISVYDSTPSKHMSEAVLSGCRCTKWAPFLNPSPEHYQSARGHCAGAQPDQEVCRRVKHERPPVKVCFSKLDMSRSQGLEMGRRRASAAPQAVAARDGTSRSMAQMRWTASSSSRLMCMWKGICRRLSSFSCILHSTR